MANEESEGWPKQQRRQEKAMANEASLRFYDMYTAPNAEAA